MILEDSDYEKIWISCNNGRNTRSIQQPNQNSGITGGKPEMIETIAGGNVIATGVDGIFLETHPNPDQAKSDESNMLNLNTLEELLTKLVRIRKTLIYNFSIKVVMIWH